MYYIHNMISYYRDCEKGTHFGNVGSFSMSLHSSNAVVAPTIMLAMQLKAKIRFRMPPTNSLP